MENRDNQSLIKRVILRIVRLVIGILFLFVFFLLMIIIPVEPIYNIFSRAVTWAEIVEGNYDESFIGEEAGEGIPVLSAAKVIDELEYEDLETSFFTVDEVVEIIPLNRYQIKSKDIVGSHTGGRRGSRRTFTTKEYYYTNAPFAEYILRLEYDRFYLLKLEDGSQVFCTLNQDYYSFLGDNTDIKFPIGRVDINVKGDEFLDKEGNEYINEGLNYLDMTQDISQWSFYLQMIFRGIISFTVIFIVFYKTNLWKFMGIDEK